MGFAAIDEIAGITANVPAALQPTCQAGNLEASEENCWYSSGPNLQGRAVWVSTIHCHQRSCFKLSAFQDEQLVQIRGLPR